MFLNGSLAENAGFQGLFQTAVRRSPLMKQLDSVEMLGLES